jgi:hypothetical protein
MRQMRIDDELKILAVKTGMTLTEMGRRMDKSPQAFSQKIKRGTFTLDDLQEIALVTGSRFECAFVLPNGDRIEIGGKR